MSSYILHWKFNIVGTRCQRSKGFKQYSLVSGIARGSISTPTLSSWDSNINGKCDICFMTRKWHHYFRDFITFTRSCPKSPTPHPTPHNSSDILGLTSVDAPRAPSTDDGCLLSELLRHRRNLVLMQCDVVTSVRPKTSPRLLERGRRGNCRCLGEDEGYLAGQSESCESISQISFDRFCLSTLVGSEEL